MNSAWRHVILAGTLAMIPAVAPHRVWARTAAQGGAAPRPAIWRTYDMIVDLTHLPRTYTCDHCCPN